MDAERIAAATHVLDSAFYDASSRGIMAVASALGLGAEDVSRETLADGMLAWDTLVGLDSSSGVSNFALAAVLVDILVGF